MARKTNAEWEQQIAQQREAAKQYGFNCGIEHAEKAMKAEAMQARTALINAVAQVAISNAKLTYAVSQIIAEKKGFGA